MSAFVIYKTDTGEIAYTITGTLHPEDIAAGHAAVEGIADPLTQYVDVNLTPPVIVGKQEMSLTINQIIFNADLVDSVMVSGLPVPVNVIWPIDTEGTITDSVAEFLTNTPGQYQLIFSSIEYLEEIVNVTAEAVQ